MGDVFFFLTSCRVLWSARDWVCVITVLMQRIVSYSHVARITLKSSLNTRSDFYINSTSNLELYKKSAENVQIFSYMSAVFLKI